MPLAGSVYEVDDAEVIEEMAAPPSDCGFCVIDPGDAWEVVSLAWVPCEGEVIEGVCHQSGCRVECFAERECFAYSIADCSAR